MAEPKKKCVFHQQHLGVKNLSERLHKSLHHSWAALGCDLGFDTCFVQFSKFYNQFWRNFKVLLWFLYNKN